MDLAPPSAGVLLGFQMSLFSWRLAEESKVRDKGETPWLTPSDFVNLAGMVLLGLGVFVLPTITALPSIWQSRMFAVAVILFVGQVFGHCGHYGLFNRHKITEAQWFPPQERVVLGVVGAIAMSYLLVVAFQ